LLSSMLLHMAAKLRPKTMMAQCLPLNFLKLN
jgi:hypothetical protein